MRAVTRCLVRHDTYRDSVELMRVAAEVERLPGITRAALFMGTPANKGLLAGAGLLGDEAATAGPHDLVIAVAAVDGAAADAALAGISRQLAQPIAVLAGSAAPAAPRTIAEATARFDGANLAVISTPGAYATAEALKALKRGLHVFVFSDNVPIADEVELKRLAVRKKLLVMGPDCGTAILDGVPLGFANVVRRGRIGLVGASGTGLQQVSCLVDRLGAGVSQVIGVGGHDLDERVGGLMMLAGIERLAADPGTAVVVLVSKPPGASVARRVLDAARAAGKPIVASFLGADPASIAAAGATPAETLEDGARLAVSLAYGDAVGAGGAGTAVAARGPGAATGFGAGPRYVRGLFSGGTLCQEAGLILAAAAGGGAAGHSAVDLGADDLTVGRPHPMIDFRLRNERLVAAAEDPTTAVILLDVVLGHGAHPDPAGALIPALDRVRALRAGRSVAVVASVCGTPGDPQDLARQEARLAAAGVVLAASNAGAARLAVGLAAETDAR